MNYHLGANTEDIRNIFLISEFEYIEKLMTIPEFVEIYRRYKEKSVEQLSTELQTLYEMMESGGIKEKDEEKVEIQMICCSLAIEDAIKKLIMSRAVSYDDEDDEDDIQLGH